MADLDGLYARDCLNYLIEMLNAFWNRDYASVRATDDTQVTSRYMLDSLDFIKTQAQFR